MSAPTMTKLTHRSLISPRELHLGAMGSDCHRCRMQARGRVLVDQYERLADRRDALGKSRRQFQAIGMVALIAATVVAVLSRWLT